MIVAVNVVEDIKELEANPSLQHFPGAIYEYDSMKKKEVQVSTSGCSLAITRVS
jgi:hypothetical protein